GREKPCFGILRNTVFRPCRERRDQCLTERVFGGRNVAGADRQERDQAPVRFAGHRLDRPVRFFRRAITHPVIRFLASGASGRTSTAPADAAGQREAQSSAASSERSSRIENPASCSLVSA